MPLNPQAKMILDQMASLNLPPLWEQSAEDARAASAARRLPPSNPDPVAESIDRTFPGLGGDVPVRIYKPNYESDLPILVWFHGGGWVLGDLEMADPTARALAHRSGVIVVSVDYRLAPEHRYPAAMDDCYAATLWVAQNASEIGGDVNRIAVGGDSAGGNLAAAVALRARDEGTVEISHQLLVYPVTSMDFTSDSYRDNAEGYLLTTKSMRWFWDHYIGPNGNPNDPYASPLAADDLSGLPNAHVITAEYDPLRDEGNAYVARLMDAGVPTVSKCYDGMIHGFFGMSEVLDDAKAAIDSAAQELKKVFE